MKAAGLTWLSRYEILRDRWSRVLEHGMLEKEYLAMKDGITKEQSKMIQGMAILMMLYHHLFATPEIFGIEYFSLLNIGGINVEQKMAYFFKICVGIYAFVSGYGMYRSVEKIKEENRDSFFKLLIAEYKAVLKKLWAFFLQYWLVFFIFVVIIGFGFFHRPFERKEFIWNLLGVSSSYNGAWWYVLQYMKMLLVFPLMDTFFTLFHKKKAAMAQIVFFGTALAAAGYLFWFKRGIFVRILLFFALEFLLCFLVGYLISRYRVYEKIYRWIPEKILYPLGILGMFSVIVIRVMLANSPSYASFDFIFVPVFLYGFCILMVLFPKIAGIFSFFGGLSTFMWLTHVFFYDHYTKSLVLATGTSTGMFFTLLLFSSLSAMALNGIVKQLRKWLGRGKKVQH